MISGHADTPSRKPMANFESEVSFDPYPMKPLVELHARLIWVHGYLVGGLGSHPITREERRLVWVLSLQTCKVL